MSYRRFGLVLIGILLVAACARSPDPDTVRQAVQDQVRRNLSGLDQLASRLGGDSAVSMLRSLGSPDPQTLHVEHLQILDSQRLDDGDYDLRVRYDIVTPNASQSTTRTIQLEKTDQGWRAVAHDAPG